MKNDANESSRDDEEAEAAAASPEESQSEVAKDSVTDQLASESESTLGKQGDTREQAVEGESKDTTGRDDESQDSEAVKKEGASIEKESADDDERDKEQDTKSIIHRMWVKQGPVFAYPSDTFTFKAANPVHSSILVMPLVSPAYQLVTSDPSTGHQDPQSSLHSAGEHHMSTNIFAHANASPHVFDSSELNDHTSAVASPQLTGDENHSVNNAMKHLFANQLISSGEQSFDTSGMRFTTAHSNSPMIPLLPFDSASAGSLFSHHQPYVGWNSFHSTSPSNMHLAPFAPVNLPTRWWHTYPSISSASSLHASASSSVASNHSSPAPATEAINTLESTTSEDEAESTSLSPVSTEDAVDTATSTESTGESVNEDVEKKANSSMDEESESGERKETVAGEKKEEGEKEKAKTDQGEVNRERSDVPADADADVDGDTGESGGRAKRQAKSEARQVDAARATGGDSSEGEEKPSTIDDVVKSIVAGNSKNNGQRGGKEEKENTASAASSPREDILKNGDEAKKALEVGLDIASDILATIRDALPVSRRTAGGDQVASKYDLTSASSGHSELSSPDSLLSILSNSPGGDRVSIHAPSKHNGPHDSGLFHVFRGVFGDLRL